MQRIIELMISSGESGVNLALFILLPVMVIMMALMRVLDDKGFLKTIAVKLSPLLILFGLPGLGVFAILQILFISFAAPIATLKIADQDESITNRRIAATLAAILPMSQANATFPLAVVGLNLPITMLTSVLGGLLSGFLAYKFAGEDTEDHVKKVKNEGVSLKEEKKKSKIIQSLFRGGEEGLQIVLKAIPPLVLSIFAVNILREIGAISLVESLLSPLLVRVGVPGIAVLPMATKYLAGGTAMMAITMELLAEGSMTAVELNRIAGFTINTFDAVGLALLLSSGPRVSAVAKPAIKAALIGILFRGILHLIIF
ncbi:nucleoside recognition family protein [Serpentinicella sp. ANB-PHB4]|uniref:nucleoside recognition family protein n=1 Tax=Serpentinicella sp. ANB-PHB4 TaxID=3074076 RepID=UPI00285E5069|nr:nucleoside recognition family protein [Serpentinicella sp. ANB-PHB4]MDR5659431.1 nucleoside recognition family protein [Serpentinicella sp. ANB-PHB4]